MVLYQGGRSRRLPSGAVRHIACKKKKSKFGRNPIETRIGEVKRKTYRIRGDNVKVKAYAVNKINVTIKKDHTSKVATVKNVASNKASMDLQRRNILTKGAIVNTDIGKVKITSRPGQVGQLSGLLLE
jgi:small subunit ribosomal protein S8e